MPNKSTGYAIGSVRVRERALLNKDKLDRLLSAQTPSEAAKLLQEYGYGAGSDRPEPQAYEKWIAESLDEAVSFLRRVAPDERIADAFLLDVDFHNLKVLFKANELGQDADNMLMAGGKIPGPVLKEAVQTDGFSLLPAGYAKACETVRKALSAAFDPQKINVLMDKAMLEMATALLTEAGFEAGLTYYRAWADKANLMALLRLKTMNRNKADLAAAYLPGGLYAEKDLLAVWEDPTALPTRSAYSAFLQAGLRAWQESGVATVLERAFDNHMLGVFTQARYNNQGSEPIVGYYLARKRECDMIRLIMVSKINGLPMSAVTERLRDLYG